MGLSLSTFYISVLLFLQQTCFTFIIRTKIIQRKLQPRCRPAAPPCTAAPTQPRRRRARAQAQRRPFSAGARRAGHAAVPEPRRASAERQDSPGLPGAASPRPPPSRARFARFPTGPSLSGGLLALASVFAACVGEVRHDVTASPQPKVSHDVTAKPHRKPDITSLLSHNRKSDVTSPPAHNRKSGLASPLIHNQEAAR